MRFQTLSVLFASLVATSAAAPPPPHKLPPCKPGHFWPDPFDCHSFFECDAGHQPVRKTCGPGTAYCWEVGVCVHEEDVPTCHHGGPPGLGGPHAGPPGGHGGPPGPHGHHGGPPAGGPPAGGPPGGL